MRSAKVCVIQYLIVQTIFCKRVVDIVITVCIPVVGELLRAKNQNAFVSGLVVFDNSQCRKSLTETNRISQNTTIVFFEFIDNGKSGVTLEVEQHIPHLAVLKAGCLVWECVLGNIIQKLAENIIEGHEVDEFGSVLVIDRRNVFNHLVSYILEVLLVVPELLKKVNIALARGERQSLREVVSIVATLTTEINRCELIKGHISVLVFL